MLGAGGRKTIKGKEREKTKRMAFEKVTFSNSGLNEELLGYRWVTYHGDG